MDIAKRTRGLSLFQLVLLALCSVLIPPALALLTATRAVEQLSSDGERAVQVAVETVELSHAIVDHLTSMERFARQRAILGDDVFWDRYLSHRAELLPMLKSLEQQPLEAPLHEQLLAVITEEQRIHEALDSAPPHSPPYAAALEDFTAMSAVTTNLRAGASGTVVATAARLKRNAHELQSSLARQGMWVVPLMVALMGLAWWSVVRPFRELDHAIRRLGKGQFDEPVDLRGPHDLQELAQRLEWLRRELLAVESERVRLFDHISHELKTPLTCIWEGVQLLSDGVAGPLSPEQQEIGTILSTNVERLHQHIEDLLRVSELRTCGPLLACANLDLADVLQQAIEHNAVAARASQVTVRLQAPSIVTWADAAKLRTVFDNLLSNAIKYGPPGRPVTIEASQHGESIEVSVQDEGTGIPPPEREAVFEAFRQGRGPWTTTKRGTGLGLTIAREYVRAHGGELCIVDSSIGTRLVARWPLRACGS